MNDLGRGGSRCFEVLAIGVPVGNLLVGEGRIREGGEGERVGGRGEENEEEQEDARDPGPAGASHEGGLRSSTRTTGGQECRGEGRQVKGVGGAK